MNKQTVKHGGAATTRWEKLKTHFVFIPTWRCNLKCEYCDYRVEKNGDGLTLKMFGGDHYVGRELPWPLWLMYLVRFVPYHVDMTGGEPLMYQDLPDLLAHLPYRCSWAITSNTLGEEKRLRDISVHNCSAWTGSFHYTRDGEFFRNVNILKEMGFGMRVTVVLTDKNEGKVRAALKTLERSGIPANIHPLLKQGFRWEDHQKVYDGFKALDDGGRMVRFVGKILPEYQEKKREKSVKCWAGVNYFMLWPDGTLFRCYTRMVKGQRLGNIKDYVPPIEGYECNRECIFTCDMDRPLKEEM